MARLIDIKTPSSVTIVASGVSALMEWDVSFGEICSEAFHKAQCFVDSEVLRLCDPHVPFREGILKNSAHLYTVIGEGEPTYQTPYAAKLYFNPQFNFFEAPQRGGLWFEVVKADHRESIFRGAQTFFTVL